MERLIDILKAMLTLSCLILSLVLVFGAVLEIYYASAIKDLALSNSNSIMMMRELMEQHFVECCPSLK